KRDIQLKYLKITMWTALLKTISRDESIHSVITSEQQKTTKSKGKATANFHMWKMHWGGDCLHFGIKTWSI
ncbi:hypothetical protein AMECASPLE_020312, partial [Ameca splendens]